MCALICHLLAGTKLSIAAILSEAVNTLREFFGEKDIAMLVINCMHEHLPVWLRVCHEPCDTLEHTVVHMDLNLVIGNQAWAILSKCGSSGARACLLDLMSK